VFDRLTPYVAISALGLFYSLLASALWPIAALIIPEYQLGTAYGLMQVHLTILEYRNIVTFSPLFFTMLRIWDPGLFLPLVSRFNL
jgi:hypothetical protein